MRKGRAAAGPLGAPLRTAEVVNLPKDTREKPEIKVTDRRLFTAEGEIREEHAGAAPASSPPESGPAAPQKVPVPPPAHQSPAGPRAKSAASATNGSAASRQTIGDPEASPGTPFSNFLEPLIAQAYISLGMMQNPYQPNTRVDPSAARQMIDILALLREKTSGNLTPDEDDLLNTHIGQLKLAYVQVTKNLS